MSERKLPVLPESTDTCGGGCDRRAFLQGITIVGLASACRIDDPGAGDDDVPVDAPTSDGPAGTGFEPCGTNQICVDLAHPANANIATGDTPGFRLITQGSTRIIIIRTDATTFITLSSRCTHAGNPVRYNPATNDVPCTFTGAGHGSQFNLDGTVKRGPAINPLTEFTNSFDAGMNVLTIDL